MFLIISKGIIHVWSNSSYLSACCFYQIAAGLPVTLELLLAVHGVWSRSFDRVMLWAAFCLGFFAFLRAGEFTCPSLKKFDPSSMLGVDDVCIDSHANPQCLTVRLKRSKCDPFGAGILVHVSFNSWPNCTYCQDCRITLHVSQ